VDEKLVRAGKFMSLVLRHRPDKIGLLLDDNGWAKIEDLVACSQRANVRLSRDLIREIVATNDKKRFVLSADGERVRAAQGHSIPVDLELAPQKPPERLFHGTAARFVPSIHQQGLLRGRRQHVHLSLDRATAVKVGQRHGKPVVLTVHAGQMWQAGIPFFLSENGVWLTEWVAPEFIHFPDEGTK
jgi:putative RNA 2'-phosphotransferase